MDRPSRARRPILQSDTTVVHLADALTVVDNLPKISAPRQSESPRINNAPGLIGAVGVATVEEVDVGVEPIVATMVMVVEVVVEEASTA